MNECVLQMTSAQANFNTLLPRLQLLYNPVSEINKTPAKRQTERQTDRQTRTGQSKAAVIQQTGRRTIRPARGGGDGQTDIHFKMSFLGQKIYVSR